MIRDIIEFVWRLGMSLKNRIGGGGGDNCSIEYIFENIEKVAQYNGTIYLRKKGFDSMYRKDDFIGAASLEIKMINGDYYMLLLYYEEDGDTDVRSFTNVERSSETIDFDYENLSGGFICNDLSVIKEVCRQFVETGDVSRDLLD